MSAWRLLIAAILCGLLGASALAQEEPGAPTPSDEDAQWVPFRIGVLLGDNPLLMDPLEASRELIERFIARREAPADVSGYEDLVAKLKSLQYIDDYYPELLEWSEEFQAEFEAHPEDAELVRPLMEAFEREIEHAGVWVEANRRYFEADYQGALKLLFPIAIEGNAPAQHAVGWAYFTGNGVDRNRCLATIWYDKGARGGYAKAQFSLGIQYWTSRGVRRDLILAWLWLRVAERGVSDSREIADHIWETHLANLPEAWQLEIRQRLETFDPSAQPLVELEFAPAWLFEEPDMIDRLMDAGLLFCE